MGRLRNSVGKSSAFPAITAGRNAGSRLWNQVFGKPTDKEDRRVVDPRADGGSYGRSVASGHAAVKRLIQALASMAPGGWSDDRYAETRSYIGIIYVSIFRICQHLRRAQFEVFIRDDSTQIGKRPVRRSDEAWALVDLLREPNEDDSFGNLMVEINMQLDLTGMSLTWMVPSRLQELLGRGGPARLYPIKTATAIPQPAINPEFPDGYWRIQPVYPYGPFSSYPTPTSAVGAPIPAQQVIRIKYEHPLLRYDGYSPQTGMSSWIDQFNTIDASRNYSMNGEMNPSATLETGNLETDGGPIPEPELERLIAEFESTVGGPANMGKLLVPPPGWKLSKFGSTPDKMCYEAGWEQVGSAIFGGYGITKQAAGIVEDSSYGTLFATLKQLYWTTLDPKCEMIAEKLTRHLAPFYGDDLIIEIKCKPIDDHEINFGKFDKGVQGKCMTKNEGRKLIDLPPTDEPWGNDIAGDPSPYEKEQAEKGQEQPGGLPGGGPPTPPPIGDKAESEIDEGNEGEGSDKPVEARPEPPEIAAERPKAGKLAEGAKNPVAAKLKRFPMIPQVKRLQPIVRKPIEEVKTKSVYEQIREMLHNGNGTNGTYTPVTE